MSTAQTAFVGDDLKDVAVRPVVGLLFSTADACLSIRDVSDAVLQRRGGHGALRELVERILKCADAGENCIEKVGREDMFKPP